MKKTMLFAAAVLLSMGASCPRPDPGPVPTPTPPPVKQAKYMELLLRTDGVRLIRPNTPGVFWPFGAVQCCEGTKVNGVEINTLWPLASESWMDYAKANMYHFRLGPFYGDADHESEWTGIGGAYAGGPGSDFNPAFWDKVVALVEYAGSKGAVVEIDIIDTWYCKRSSTIQGFRDQQMPWPQEDIDACGIRGTAEQEKFIRKAVSTLNDYANVIWITDNEGGEIRGAKRDWYLWVQTIIRDEEQKGEFKIVRLIGTNNTDFCDGPFDYCATHARAALTQPIAGKHTENNERNPEFNGEQEFANYCKAQEAGLHYWFWRAGMSQEDADWLLGKMQQGCGGVTIGCFPPADDDPLWVEPPVAGPVGTNMRSALEAAKAVVGSRCGTDHMGSLHTLDLLGAELRKKGYCAGRATDSVFIKTPENKWQEFHAVAFATGCYANDPNQLPKNTWIYGGTPPEDPNQPTPPPTGACPDPQPPPLDHFNMKIHIVGPNWTTVDATPIIHNSAYCNAIGFDALDCPVRAEGDPNREACEAQVVGQTSWTGPGETMENPYQYRVRRGTSGLVTVCSSGNVCGSVFVQP